MTTAFKTQAANVALNMSLVSAQGALKLEEMAGATLQMQENFKTIGSSADAYEMTTRSSGYRNLSATERSAFAQIYGEMLGKASGTLGSAAPRDSTLSEAYVTAAFHEVFNVIGSQQRKARAHGPGVEHEPPSWKGYSMDGNPQDLVRHAARVKAAEDSTGPYLLVTYDTSKLGPERSEFYLAKSDITPESFLSALRTAMGGAFADVEIRAQSEEDYEAGIPAPKATVSSDANAATGIALTPAEEGRIESARNSEIPFEAARGLLLEELAGIPSIAERFSDGQLDDLTDALMNFENVSKDAGLLIREFAEQNSPPK